MTILIFSNFQMEVGFQNREIPCCLEDTTNYKLPSIRYYATIDNTQSQDNGYILFQGQPLIYNQHGLWAEFPNMWMSAWGEACFVKFKQPEWHWRVAGRGFEPIQ